MYHKNNDNDFIKDLIEYLNNIYFNINYMKTLKCLYLKELNLNDLKIFKNLQKLELYFCYIYKISFNNFNNIKSIISLSL